MTNRLFHRFLAVSAWLFAGLHGADAATVIPITNPGFDQGTGGQITGQINLAAGSTSVGPQLIGTSGWYGLANNTNFVFGGTPLAGFRPGIAVNNGGLSSGKGEINYAVGASLGSLAGLEMPEADLWQPLPGINLSANSTYTFSVDVDAGTLLSISSFAAAGFGIGVTVQSSSTSVGTMFADSLSNPSLLNVSLVSGTNQHLALTFTTGSTVPTGNLGLVVFGGRGTQSLSLSLLNDYRVDNASLVQVPEPAPLALLCPGAAALLLRRRRSR